MRRDGSSQIMLSKDRTKHDFAPAQLAPAGRRRSRRGCCGRKFHLRSIACVVRLVVTLLHIICPTVNIAFSYIKREMSMRRQPYAFQGSHIADQKILLVEIYRANFREFADEWKSRPSGTRSAPQITSIIKYHSW